MALEGSLKEFNLADILQLIYFQRKTGVLSVAGKTDKIRLLFQDGHIVAAESQKRDVAGRLGRVLVARGLISDRTLEDAIARQRDSGLRLGSILMMEGRATADQIKLVLISQINETVNQLFTWHEGKYEFTAQAVPVDKEIHISIDTQHVLMEGMRMLDEWTQIGDKISFDTVFIQKDNFEVELNDEEVRVLAFVNGDNDVGSIADLTGIDSFSVSMALLGLQHKGKVAKKESLTEKEIDEVTIYEPLKPMANLTLILVSTLVLSLLISGGLTWALGLKDVRGFAAARQIDSIRTECEVQFHLSGAYPATIDRTDPWGTPYSYKASAQGYTLISAGPDRILGTADDMK